MSYFLGGTNLSTFGFIPGHQPGSNLALSGFLDMPARLGKCFHDWASEVGIEPYTSASEIRFGGRDLSLTGAIIGTGKKDCIDKLAALQGLISSFTTLVNLTSDKWGTFQVYVHGDIQGDYLGEKGLKITIPFREPVVDLSGIYPAGTPDNEYGFDGISFADLGGVLTEFNGDRRNITAPKGFETTDWFKEGYRITKREASKLHIQIFISQSDFNAFRTKIKSLYQLFKAPGERNLIVKDDLYRRVFACDGFKVSKLNKRNAKFYGLVDIDLMQVGTAQSQWYYLADNAGNLITDNLNNKIIV